MSRVKLTDVNKLLESITRYVKLQFGPSPGSTELRSKTAFESFLTEPKSAIVGFFQADTKLKSAFLELADRYRENVRFGHTSHHLPDVMKLHRAIDDVIIFRGPHLANKYEPTMVKYIGHPTVDDLERFVKDNFHGLVGHRTRYNRIFFQRPFVVAYFKVDFGENCAVTNYWRKELLKVAVKNPKIHFGISNKGDFEYEIAQYGITGAKGDMPIFVAKDKAGYKYVMIGEYSRETLETFVADLQQGKLIPYIKSQTVPNINIMDPVKVAVGMNFNEVALNNGKDTFICFIAPWCGYCKRLAPTYRALAKNLKNEDIEIVMVDADSNDVPPTFDIRAFPTIYWVSKDRPSQPVKYTGERETEHFIKFIAKHSTNELRGFDRNGIPRQSDPIKQKMYFLNEERNRQNKNI